MFAGAIPTNAKKHIDIAGNGQRICARARKKAIARQKGEDILSAAMYILPCSEMDTVDLTYQPKDFFPLLGATT